MQIIGGIGKQRPLTAQKKKLVAQKPARRRDQRGGIHRDGVKVLPAINARKIQRIVNGGFPVNAQPQNHRADAERARHAHGKPDNLAVPEGVLFGRSAARGAKDGRRFSGFDLVKQFGIHNKQAATPRSFPEKINTT